MSLEDLKQDVRELSRQVSRIAEDTARNTVILAEHIRRTELLEKASMSRERVLTLKDVSLMIGIFTAILSGLASMLKLYGVF